MAVTFVSSGTVEYPTGGTSATFTLSLSPSTFQVGDVLVASLSTTSGSATTLSAPSGAVGVFTPTSGPDGVNGGVYVYPIPGPTKPSSVTWTWPSAQRGTLAWVLLRGADAVNPIDSSGVGAWSSDYVTSWSAPSFTTAVADTFLVSGTLAGTGSNTLTIPAGWTLRTDATQREGTMATKGTVAAGSQAGITYSTPPAPVYGRAWQLAIRPLGAPAVPSTVPGASMASFTDPVDRWTKPTTRVSWFNQALGKWAAILPTATGHRLFADLSAPSAGVVVDSRMGSRPTVVHHAGWTGVLRSHATASRFSSFDADYAPLLTDVSVPLTAANTDQSPIALLRSPNGFLWAANVESGNVRVTRSTDGGASWATVQNVVTGWTLFPTGLVSLLATGSTVVLVATGNDGSGRAARSISQASATFAAGDWAVETLPALASGISSDDHLSATVAPDGRVLAVAKTTNGSTNVQLLYLLARSTGGVWSSSDVEVGPDDDPASPGYTRPGITIAGDQVVVAYGSFYSPTDLSVRKASLSDLTTWTTRSVLFSGPDYSDGAQLPDAPHVFRGGLTFPVLAHDRDSETITLDWVSSGNAAGPTVSQLIVGAVTGTGFTVSVKSSGQASVRAKVGTDEWVTAGVVYGSSGTVDGDGWAKSTVTGLSPSTTYYVAVEGTTAGSVVTTGPPLGEGKTLPAAGVASFTFGFGSCFDHLNGSLTTPVSGAFGRLAARDPDLFFHLGDFTYADNTGSSQASHRGDLESVLNYSAAQRSFLARTPSVYVKSDHDAGGGNNSFPGSWTAGNRAAALQVFPYGTRPDSNGLYHSFVVGRVRFIVTDTRYFAVAGSTRLGATQKAWFKAELQQPEPVKVWVQEAAWIDNKAAESGGDKWQDFAAEKSELGSFIAASAVGQVVTIHGDQHALAADDGSHNSWGGFPSFAAAPFRNLSSLKTASTSDWSAGVYPASTGADVAQYGFVTVTDTSNNITLAFRGYDTANVERVSLDVVVSTVPEVVAGFTGSGALTSSVSSGYVRAAAFAGVGVLSAVAETTLVVERTAAFDGGGVLSAMRVVAATRTAPFAGAGVLMAVAVQRMTRTALLAGSGALSASVTARLARAAAFAGSGSLTALVQLPNVLYPVFTGVGSLSAVAVVGSVTVAVSAPFTGLGVLSAVAGTPVFVFTPPTYTERWPVDDVFFRRLTVRRSVSVLKESGFYRQAESPSAEEITAADVAYLGGHAYPVDEAEVLALTAAGYGEFIEGVPM